MAALQTESFRGVSHVETGALQFGEYYFALETFYPVRQSSCTWTNPGDCAARREHGTNLVRVDFIARSEQHESLDHVAKLANVARPGILLKSFYRFGGKRHRLPTILCADLGREVFDQRRNILVALTQRWKREREDVNTVK